MKLKKLATLRKLIRFSDQLPNFIHKFIKDGNVKFSGCLIRGVMRLGKFLSVNFENSFDLDRPEVK